MRYNYEEQSWVRATAFSALQDSASAAYAAYYFGGKIDARQRLLKNAGAIASVEVTENYDTDAGTRTRERTVDRIFQAGLDYQLREGLGIRAIGGYEKSTAQVAAGFSRWTASAAVNAAF